MSKLKKQKNSIKKLYSSVIITACLVVALLVAFEVYSYQVYKENKLDEINITIEGETVNEEGLKQIYAHIGQQTITFSLSIEPAKNYDKSDIVWFIEGETYGCTITQYGVFSVGNEQGVVKVGVTAKTVNKVTNYFLVHVNKVLTSMTVDTSLATTSYIENQYLNLQGVKFYFHYNDGSSRELTQAEYAQVVIDKTQKLVTQDTQVIATYTHDDTTVSTTFGITVRERVLDSLVISTNPTKLNYIEYQLFNTAGMVVTAVYDNEDEQIVTNHVTFSALPLSISDTNNFIISYTDNGVTKTATLNIMVVPKSLSQLVVVQNANIMNYLYGETFLNDGLIVKAIYDNDQEQIVTSLVTYKTQNLNYLDDNNFIITYTEDNVTRQTTLPITVAQKTLIDIELFALPTNIYYFTGNYIDLSGLVVKAVYENGNEKPIVTTYSSNKTNVLLAQGDEVVTISYTEGGITKTANFIINITYRELDYIEVMTEPAKVIYTEGEYFDIMGLTIMAHYENSAAAQVQAFTHNKQGIALTTLDTQVVLEYTENGVSKNAAVQIQVIEQQQQDQAIAFMITSINALPQPQNITLQNKTAIEYLLSVYENDLNSTQQGQVTNYSTLVAANNVIVDLLNSENQPPEIEYNIYYTLFYDDQIFADINYLVNPSVYKNSDGVITLTAVLSQDANILGYEFIGWYDKNINQYVTQIEELLSAKTLYAVFELSQEISITYKDYETNETLYVHNVSRVQSNNSTTFNFSNNDINNLLIANAQVFALNYYIVVDTQKVVVTAISLAQGSNIEVYVKVVNYRTLTLENDGEVVLNYTTSYQNEFNEQVQVSGTYTSGTSFKVPVGATLYIYVINTNIINLTITDGITLVVNSGVYSFEVQPGEASISIGFVRYASSTVSVLFMGINTKSYTYLSSWDGQMTTTDLDDVRFVFDENNNLYLNRYLIGNQTLTFNELQNYTFEGNTLVTVERVINRFNLVFVYDGGIYAINNLLGKQTLEQALIQLGYNVNAELTQIINHLTTVNLYKDENRSQLFIGDLLTTSLAANITLYLSHRQEFVITFNTNGGSVVDSLLIPSNVSHSSSYNLYSKLDSSYKHESLFLGWSTAIDGEVLTEQYTNLIIQNTNQDITLYAVWQLIEENYVLVTIYNTHTNSVTEQLLHGDTQLSELSTYSYSLFYVETTQLSANTLLKDIAQNKRAKVFIYNLAQVPATGMKIVTLNLDGGHFENPQMPNYIAYTNQTKNNGYSYFNYLLQNIKPIKEGHHFVGWYTSSVGGQKVNSFVETYNLAINELFAIYEPTSSVDYTGRQFVGVWQNNYINEFGVIGASLEVFADGTYSYHLAVNSLSYYYYGEYRAHNNDITILSLNSSLSMSLVPKQSFVINTTFINENIILVPMIMLAQTTYTTYIQYLVKGNVVAANYSGQNMLDTYVMQSNEIINEETYLNTITITLQPNGTAHITIEKQDQNEIVTYSQEHVVLYRLVNNDIWIISNTQLKIFILDSQNFIKANN